MDQSTRKSRPIYDATSRPLIPRHVKLRFDMARDRWVILVPERVLVPDDIAVEVLQLCDGQRRIQDVVDLLAAKYTADPDLIPLAGVRQFAESRSRRICSRRPVRV